MAERSERETTIWWRLTYGANVVRSTTLIPLGELQITQFRTSVVNDDISGTDISVHVSFLR